MNDKWYNSDMASHIGQGVGLFLFIVALGTCSALDKGHIKFGEDKKEQNK
jgi:hypothetical protein